MPRFGSLLVIPVILLVCLFEASDVQAQSVVPGPPGPYVVDVRATTMAVPQAFGFYPDVPASILVPSRGFGVDLGGHVYIGQVGPARLGVGAAFVQLRGTADDDVAITVRTVTPQASFNFGTSRGWSYLSGGLGVAQIQGRYVPEGGGAAAVRSSGAFLAMNAGGGARWFIRPRFAFTLDLRVHRLGARAGGAGAPPTPASFLGAAGAGFSFR